MDKITLIYDYVNRRSKSDVEFKSSITSVYKRNSRWSNGLLRFMVFMMSIFLRPRSKAVKYFFWGSKFEDIILGMDRREICVLGGPKQLRFCIKNGVKFIPVMNFWKGLSRGLESDFSLLKLEDIHSLTKLFYVYAGESPVLVVDTDSLPMQRVVLTAFSSMSTGRSICIQHGVFQSKTQSDLLDGWMADNFFVMDENQHKIMISKGMERSKLAVMGFYSSPYIPIRTTSRPSQRKVCFFGQPWARYGEARAAKYLDILKRVESLTASEGLEFFYKLHPWESGLDYVAGIQGRVNCGMEQALENFDVFVSITSTALLEAGAAGRIAIQVMDEDFSCDDFSTFSSVKAIDVESDSFNQDLKSCINGVSGEVGNQVKPAELFLSALEGAK
ncbi:hypothetical protein [Pseudomonas sp. Hg5Tf]|uniref:CDP-Glycerol:Poly(Glycerophosphate) glycerophosphotransferase n=1 Tax=Pseudomonas sp. Hg7Tf TaxID=3236988 RepID=A0AB39I442_9PSED|nr:hypothetical protein [Pseudomonas sp. Hg5Tf]MDH2557797.1 hypothetical protein [Pseudomonas sp. Hg5Tf]